MGCDATRRPIAARLQIERSLRGLLAAGRARPVFIGSPDFGISAMLAKDLSTRPSAPALRFVLWAFVFAMLCVSIVLSGSHTLMGTDESREAGMSREMADTGDYVVPRLNGQPFLEK